MNIQEAQDYFYNLHDIEVNQKYAGNLPYSFHLEMVHNQGKKFSYLIDPKDDKFTSIACFGHDSIEDARLSYNDIKDKFGVEIAEIIYLCTENKGRNRLARKSKEFYKELATNELAVFVKLCDLIANVKFSLLSNSSMYDKYKNEYPKIKEYLYIEKYKDMFDYLDKLFKI